MALPPGAKIIGNRVWVPRTPGYESDDPQYPPGAEEAYIPSQNDPVLQGMLTIGDGSGWGWNHSAGAPEPYQGGWLLPAGLEPYQYNYAPEDNESLWSNALGSIGPVAIPALTAGLINPAMASYFPNLSPLATSAIVGAGTAGVTGGDPLTGAATGAAGNYLWDTIGNAMPSFEGAAPAAAPMQLAQLGGTMTDVPIQDLLAEFGNTADLRMDGGPSGLRFTEGGGGLTYGGEFGPTFASESLTAPSLGNLANLRLDAPGGSGIRLDAPGGSGLTYDGSFGPTFAAESLYAPPMVGGTTGDAGTGGSNTVKNLVTGGGAAGALARLAGFGQTGTDLTTLLGALAPGLIGAYASGEQADALGDLASQQRGAEEARYQDIVQRDEARYQTALQRENEAIARQRGDIEFGRNLGAPSRERYEGSFAPGFDIGGEAGFSNAMDTTTDTLLRRLSAEGGNPFGNPGGLAEVNKYVMGNVALPYLNQYRSQNAATGGYGSYAGAGGSVPGIGSGMPTGASAGSGVGAGGSNSYDLASVTANGNIWNSLGYGVGNVFNPPRSLADILKDLKGSSYNLLG